MPLKKRILCVAIATLKGKLLKELLSRFNTTVFERRSNLLNRGPETGSQEAE